MTLFRRTIRVYRS